MINPKIQEEWANGAYECALKQRLIGYDSPSKEKYDWLINPRTREDALVSSLTFGEFLYKMACIDPLVIAAADFSSVEAINNSLSFTNYVGRFDGYSSESFEGVLNPSFSFRCVTRWKSTIGF